MFIRHELNDVNKISSSVLTFGNFDGMHLGHQKIIRLVENYSKQNNIPSVVMSFTPHTKSIIFKNKNYRVLTSAKCKTSIMKNLGIKIYCNINFTKEFSILSPESFMQLIINKYNPKYLILGYDNKFGKEGKGDIEYLEKINKYSNINIIQVNPLKIKGSIVKTTLIKELILNNNISIANELIGRKYRIEGIVVKGSSIGRSIGFPTANIEKNEKKQIIPKDGVYSVNLIFNSAKYKAVCNIGMTPTLNLQHCAKIEVHLINQDIDLYNKNVVIEFNHFIRNEIKFKNKQELVNQINVDIASIEIEGE